MSNVPEKNEQPTEDEFEDVLAALLQVDPEGIVGTSEKHRRKPEGEHDDASG